MNRALWTILALCLSMPAAAFRLADGRWPAEAHPIAWALDRDGTRLPGRGTDVPSLRNAVIEAFSLWTSVSGADLRLAAPSSLEPDAAPLAHDGLNAVSWIESDAATPWAFGSGALAVTVPVIEGDRIVEADVAFNARDYRWGLGRAGAAACEGEVDLRAVALHEAGHFFGLAHSCEIIEIGTPACEGLDDSVMTAAYGLHPLVRLGRDDIEGIRALYPGELGSRDDLCLADGDCASGLGCIEGRCGGAPDSDALLCRACATDADCEGAPCVRGDGYAYCSTGCSIDVACPSGYTCVGLEEGRGVACRAGGCFCVPDAGRCPELVACEACGGEGGGCGAVVGCEAPRWYVTDGGAFGRCVDPASAVDAGDPTTPNENPPEPCGCGPAGFSWWGLCAAVVLRRRATQGLRTTPTNGTLR